MTIVRGLPGSGKSTYAKKLADETGAVHIESDMYFEQGGEYKFDPSKLQAAHKWCQNEFRRLYQAGKDIIVSNTFTQIWEAEIYFDFFDIVYETEVITLTENFGSIHGVPEITLERMKKRFDSHEKFCEHFGVSGND